MAASDIMGDPNGVCIREFSTVPSVYECLNRSIYIMYLDLVYFGFGYAFDGTQLLPCNHLNTLM